MDKEVKEERIRNIALSYYSRKDVLDAMFKFSNNREVSPRYYEGFGKRPDSFQYPTDISALVKKGATSFHCSEEIWSNPLEISTDLNELQLNDLRSGWDLVIDIDCKWIYYSKKAALAIIEVLENHGVKNIGIKFSGGKGFHIIVPWEAFPTEINNVKTSDNFPEYPRAIVNYLKEKSRKFLEQSIKGTESDFKKVRGFIGIKCESCNNLSEENFNITLRCSKCYPAHIETFRSSTKEYRERKCPSCNSKLHKVSIEKFYYCNHCDLNSIENKKNFNEQIESVDVFELLGLDVLLVSPRHLFRMPYSLHEKTSLASVVIPKNKIQSFELTDANPLNVKVLEFYPTPKKNEAKSLLFEAIDFQRNVDRNKENKKIKYKEKKEFKKIILKEVKDDYLPPSIVKILRGMNDGKKRSLFILINLFRSLGMNMEEVEKRLTAWNKLNNPPLKKGYIDAQLQWHSRHKSVLPPNFNNEIYKAIGVYELDELSRKVKNPVSYIIRKSGAWKKKN